VVLEALDDLDEAIELHRSAIRLAPQSLLARQNVADAVRTPQQIQEHPPQAWLPLMSVPGLLGVASGDPLVRGLVRQPEQTPRTPAPCRTKACARTRFGQPRSGQL
jgi:hypothetical protein